MFPSLPDEKTLVVYSRYLSLDPGLDLTYFDLGNRIGSIRYKSEYTPEDARRWLAVADKRSTQQVRPEPKRPPAGDVADVEYPPWR